MEKNAEILREIGSIYYLEVIFFHEIQSGLGTGFKVRTNYGETFNRIEDEV